MFFDVIPLNNADNDFTAIKCHRRPLDLAQEARVAKVFDRFCPFPFEMIKRITWSSRFESYVFKDKQDIFFLFPNKKY